jgi:hypothetical protein
MLLVDYQDYLPHDKETALTRIQQRAVGGAH